MTKRPYAVGVHCEAFAAGPLEGKKQLKMKPFIRALLPDTVIFQHFILLWEGAWNPSRQVALPESTVPPHTHLNEHRALRIFAFHSHD